MTEPSTDISNLARHPARVAALFVISTLLGVRYSAIADDLARVPTNWVQASGIYPHLAFFNDESECGTGAVVPWAGRLWAITYAPHKPTGSTDKLYEIDEQLNRTVRPESVGGTPANRMIHRESKQLFIGPYVIDRDRRVRVIKPSAMPGRLTGNARHLSDPARKIFYATMEEGFYEVDVRTLQVRELYPDGNRQRDYGGQLLPGYHGKGLYSGQGHLVYANNGERSSEALRRPDIASGCLAEWEGEDWRVVRRNQFTEVTGPGGIEGNADPNHDPVWSIGWDHRSLILMVLDKGKWHSFRLPKASHCYDGAHGWNTEWPRIREIGEGDLLMTMHGMFWRFPRSMSSTRSAGIAPRSTYLKVIGDFCRWNDFVVFGCDDTAKNEFLNKRKAKGKLAGPGQSQSNLWFVHPDRLDQLGTPEGRGAVWLDESVPADQPSDPILFSGFERRAVHLALRNDQPATVAFEVDRLGTGEWQRLRDVTIPANGYRWIEFSPREAGAWVRLRPTVGLRNATALFHFSNRDRRTTVVHDKFAALAKPLETSFSGGIVRARGDDKRTLHIAASDVRDGKMHNEGYYELDADMQLRAVDDPQTHTWLKQNAAVPDGVLTVDEASALYVNEQGRRFRLPKGDMAFDETPAIPLRVDREVCTERDLFNCHGTFYELPAENAGGFAKIRPIATHNRWVTDYCSWRGLLVMTGISSMTDRDTQQIIRSDDGQCAIWVGAVDDLWRLGKPVGQGGPWMKTAVRAGQPSDPYLMNGFDEKAITLSHDAPNRITLHVDVDITGAGQWQRYESFDVDVGEELIHSFPQAFHAYWVRLTSNHDAVVTGQLSYE